MADSDFTGHAGPRRFDDEGNRIGRILPPAADAEVRAKLAEPSVSGAYQRECDRLTAQVATLTAERDAAREALRPFALFAGNLDASWGDGYFVRAVGPAAYSHPTVGACRRAADVLRENP